MNGAWPMAIQSASAQASSLEGHKCTSLMKRQKQSKNISNRTEQSNGIQTPKLLQEAEGTSPQAEKLTS